MITASGATNSFTHGLVAVPAVDGDAGRGEVNNAATWDEFPNGRFGDYKSPAFGDQDQWGGSRLSVRLYCLFSELRSHNALDFDSEMKHCPAGAIPSPLSTSPTFSLGTSAASYPRRHSRPPPSRPSL